MAFPYMLEVIAESLHCVRMTLVLDVDNFPEQGIKSAGQVGTLNCAIREIRLALHDNTATGHDEAAGGGQRVSALVSEAEKNRLSGVPQVRVRGFLPVVPTPPLHHRN